MLSISGAIVQSSFAELGSAGPDLAKAFYKELFDLDPSLRALFSGDIHTQEAQLLAMIRTGVGLLGEPHRLQPILRQLGRRHVSYGVGPNHYRLVGLALARSLELCLGAGFTDEVRKAWLKFCQMIINSMIEGAIEVAEAG